MKKSELESMIREAVRKECKDAFYDVLTEMFSEKQPQISKNIKREVRREDPKPKTEPKKFCNDPILNQLLAETADNPVTTTRMLASRETVPSYLGELPTLTSPQAVPSSIDEIKQLNESAVSSIQPHMSHTVEEMQYQASNVPDMFGFAQNGKSRFAEVLKKSMEKSKQKMGG